MNHNINIVRARGLPKGIMAHQLRNASLMIFFFRYQSGKNLVSFSFLWFQSYIQCGYLVQIIKT